MSAAEEGTWRWRMAAWVFGGLVLTASLAVVWRELGSSALWRDRAHESADRALLFIALYPGHALREVPHVFLLGLCWLAGLSGPRTWREAWAQCGRSAAFAAAFTALLAGWSGLEDGWDAAWLNLSQGHAAPGLTEAGVHFRFHLWSDLALGGIFFGVGRCLAPLDRSHGARGLALAIGLFLCMLLRWGADGAWSPRFAGHQAREIFTHVLVTLPLLAGFAWQVGRAAAPDFHRPAAWLGWGVGAGLCVAIGVRVLSVDIMAFSSDPSRGVALNLAAHQFEHLLDFAMLAGMTALGGFAAESHKSA
ncbi:MAG: hypothetical protein AMXMBFR7_12230 [Planctomycetota bacterium]